MIRAHFGIDRNPFSNEACEPLAHQQEILDTLSQAFGVEHAATHYKCEKNLIAEAFALKQAGRSVLPLIDDAHLMEIDTLRRLRLLFADFPHNNNLVLFGQPQLLTNLALGVHEDIRSRITYSVNCPRLGPDDMEKFLFGQLDRCGLPHSTFAPEALGLVVRTADGLMRRARNMALSCLLEAVRARKRTVDLENVNRVLMQPHWREERDFEAKTPN